MKQKLLILISLLAIVLWVSSASATTITFSLPAGSVNSGGEPVSASVRFITSTNSVTVDIWNTEANVMDVAQCISDVFFILSSGNSGAASITSSSGLERTVAGDKTFSDGSVVATGWALTTVGAGFELSALSAPATPTHLIIGPPAADNKYDAAMGSIAANPAHNPFLFGNAPGNTPGPVEFVLSIAGVTADTSLSGVSFSFGTTPGDNVPVPISPSALLLGSGLLGLVGWRRFRKN